MAWSRLLRTTLDFEDIAWVHDVGRIEREVDRLHSVDDVTALLLLASPISGYAAAIKTH
jgi:hypothetical protein